MRLQLRLGEVKAEVGVGIRFDVEVNSTCAKMVIARRLFRSVRQTLVSGWKNLSTGDLNYSFIVMQPCLDFRPQRSISQCQQHAAYNMKW